MGYMGAHILMFVPIFISIMQARTKIGMLLSNYGLLHEDVTLAYKEVFLEELSSGLFSVVGFFGNSDFLSLLAGFSNKISASCNLW